MKTIILTVLLFATTLETANSANRLCVQNETSDFVLYFIPFMYKDNSVNCGVSMFFNNITVGNVSGYCTVQPGAANYFYTSTDVTKPWNQFYTNWPDPNVTDNIYPYFKRTSGTASYTGFGGGGATTIANSFCNSNSLQWGRMSAKVIKIGSSYTEGANICFGNFASCSGLPDNWGQTYTSALLYTVTSPTPTDYFIVG